MQKNIFRKELIIGIVFLFIGLCFVSGINIQLKDKTITNKNVNIKNLNVGSNNSGLIAYWKFNEGSGNQTYDCSGNNYNGTIYGASWTGGINGTALDFDGIDDYVQIPSWYLPAMSSFSYLLWFNPSVNLSSGSGRMDLIYGGGPYGRPCVTFNREGNGKITLHVTINDIQYEDVNTATCTWQSDTWYFITFTWDGTIFKVYLNGELENTVIHAGTHRHQPGPLNICTMDTHEFFFNGKLDEINIYNYSLTNDEITEYYEDYFPIEKVYIDDGFDENTTGWGYDHFDKIQDGIDAVNESGMVYIYNGTYYENLIVDKTINLIGEEKNTTIIDSQNVGDGIKIEANWVNISNLSITTHYIYPDYGINIDNYRNNISIYNCKMYGFHVGIEVKNSKDITLKDNHCSDCYGGLNVVFSYNITMIENNCSNNDWCGINIQYSNNNTIDNSCCINNHNGGIRLCYSSSYNFASDNICLENNGHGIWIDDSSRYNNLFNNTCNKNTNGIIIMDCTAGYNTLINNSCNSNDLRGIWLVRTTNNTVINNNVFSNSWWGIELIDSNCNYVFHNNIINSRNAYDNGSNYWDNGYPFGGNYWSDYTGSDNNNDGIGDIPFNISGGSCRDNYPLMDLWDEIPLMGAVKNLDTSEEFPWINLAIDDTDTLSGHSIYVTNGTYYENVVINKTINLIGEDKNITSIDGNKNSDVVNISADFVNFSNIKIKHSGESGWSAGIKIHSNHTNVFNNIITNNWRGINLQDNSSNNIISSNIFINNDRDGIDFQYSFMNIISSNIITNNNEGIELSYYSNNNTIFDNFISENYDGIEVHFYCSNNQIYENNITLNDDNSIDLQFYSNNNNIFHNNMINNSNLSFDSGTNIWDDGYPSGGNYWDIYNGNDLNEDGIGDTPLNISGGSNKDWYPLMELWDENPPVSNFTYSINDKLVLFNASTSFDRDGVIINYEWDFDDGSYGTGLEISHNYSSYGTYNVTLNVTDDDNKTDGISKYVNVIDEILPIISDVEVYPPIQAPSGFINISAFVTDNVGLSDVRLILEYPDNQTGNISIIQNKINDTYFCNSTYDLTGTYNFYIWANDTSNNTVNSTWNSFQITEEFVCDADGPYEAFIHNEIQFEGFVVNGQSPYTWFWDFGDGDTSDDQNPKHTYANPGNFTVALTVTDYYGNKVNDTTWTFIKDCQPPLPPNISGPTKGKPNINYQYQFLLAQDPNGDISFIYVDWGDNTNSGWVGPYSSGETITIYHSWPKKQVYTIKAKAKNICGDSNNWNYLEVSIPRNVKIINSLMQRFLQNHPNLISLLEKLINILS